MNSDWLETNQQVETVYRKLTNTNCFELIQPKVVAVSAMVIYGLFSCSVYIILISL